MATETINIRPAASLVQAALDHSKLEHITVNEDGSISVRVGASMPNLAQPLLDLAMEKHVRDTMILPSNVSAIREVSRFLASMLRDPRGSWQRADIEECIERLDSVSDNLDPDFN